MLSSLLPCSCALCGERADEVVCTPCTARYATRGSRVPGALRVLRQPARHGRRRGQCGACLADPPAFDATLAACDYEAPLDGLVLALKFGARLPLAPWFGQRLSGAVLARPGWPLPDVLCPVPPGPGRLVERGYNQALEIARPLARGLGIALAPRLLTRVVETAAQSGVAPRERARNIRGAFAVTPGMAHLVSGRHIGVVDDVMTSGHTLNEVAATLKAAGAARVSNLVFARTPPH
ncbi:ComF family protein [Massilia sp. Se16.2.3]|uniref:ComF family protein n=1 Tax=Massilia sp. Se16.2.3 TaxID=2709303 RepID=UPI001E4FF7E2|nr:ComF family protein [Massilia sp. Se16.2.3]